MSGTRIAIPLVLLAMLAGCEQYNAQQPSGCGTNTATIGVKDTYLLNECGCNETAGTTKLDGNPLTCTVPVGTWVVFDMSKTKERHQIISVGTPSFASGPVHDPSNGDTAISHVVQFTTAGTYQFQDQFETGLSGQIVAQ